MLPQPEAIPRTWYRGAAVLGKDEMSSLPFNRADPAVLPATVLPEPGCSDLLLAKQGVGRAQSLEREAITQQVLHQSLDVLGGGDPGVAQYEV